MMDNKNLLPVIIIPGFMSSGLEIKNSDKRKHWINKRIWLNLKSLGFESFSKSGRVNYIDEEKKNETSLECVNDWLGHMCLQEDMQNETCGVEIRAIPGLEGVDYLTPGTLTNHLSYVFGPVIDVLKGSGYTENNLAAAPYDWRLPPNTLETRDRYFSNLIQKVEELFLKNNNTPVVLLCHSLGCKTGHYFLNFAKARVGQQWLNTYVHTFMPVGAPHIGAPKSIRSLVTGDKMGLDAFLKDEEGLAIARSFGSGPWLMPCKLPKECAPPNVWLRKDGLLHIEIMPTDFSPLFQNICPMPKVKICILYGSKKKLTAGFKNHFHQNYVYFPERFIFSVPNSPTELEAIQIILYEPGLGLTRKLSETGPYYSWMCCPLRSFLKILRFPIKYCLCLLCLVIYKILQCVLCTASHATEAAAKQMGGTTMLAVSGKQKLSKFFGQNKQEEILEISLEHCHNKKGGILKRLFRKQTRVTLTLNLKFIRSTLDYDEHSNLTEIAAIESPPKFSSEYQLAASNFLPIHATNMKATYKKLPGHELLQKQGLVRVDKLLHDIIDSDELGPRSLSAFDPPPIKLVKAIYGINLPTEVGAVYKHSSIVLSRQKIQSRFELDIEAKPNTKNYKISKGIILEHKATPQVIHHPKHSKNVSSTEVLRCSGDGTVPYWSLQHCRTWQGLCDVTIHELEGAEHREILADVRFHDILLDYLLN